MFGSKGIVTIKDIHPFVSYVTHGVIDFRIALWEHPGEVIGVCVLNFLRPTSWGKACFISHQCHGVLRLPWRWMRNQTWGFYGPRTCDMCGWLSGRLPLDNPLCNECHNIGVCQECHYCCHDTGQFKCIQCEPMLSPLPEHKALNSFLEFFQLYDKIDEVQGGGYYAFSRGNVDLTVMRLVMKTWHSVTLTRKILKALFSNTSFPQVKEQIAGFALQG